MLLDLDLWPALEQGDEIAERAPETTLRSRAPGQRWDESMTGRLRALLHAGPLLRLKRGESWLDEEAQQYDLLALALAVFDLIIENTGLDGEVDRRGVLEYLRPLMLEMDRQAEVEPDPARHARVIDKVLGALLNEEDRRRPFTIEYTAFDEQGMAKVHRLQFRLVEYRHHPDGRIVLSLSSGAANLFLRALDLDIEDSQIANTAILKTQIARGRFQKAVRAAEESRLLSIRLKAKIERAIRDTRRNIRQVDWAGSISEMLKSALDHVTTQIDEERAIAASAHDRLESLEPGSEATQHLARVRDLIAECVRRHVELHGPLITARSVFLDEQERQSFLPPGSGAYPDLEEQVLLPLLRMEYGAAADLLETGAAPFIGPVAPAVLNLAEMITWQLRPRREPTMPGSEVEEREIVEIGRDLARYPEEVRAAAGRYLDAVAAPTPLSEVIARADAASEEAGVIECVALLAFRLFGPDNETAVGLRAVRSGRQLGIRGLSGDDLTLTPKEAHG